MGLISRVLASGAISSVGEAAGELSEVFLPNATRQMELSHEAYGLALEAAAEEYRTAGTTAFDRFVNGLNRLPRPLLALGTIGLFVHAMADPAGFAERMAGLGAVPEPLWWLMGAVVGFYFGARELHYLRRPSSRRVRRPAGQAFMPDPDNAALSDWRASRRDPG